MPIITDLSSGDRLMESTDLPILDALGAAGAMSKTMLPVKSAAAKTEKELFDNYLITGKFDPTWGDWIAGMINPMNIPRLGKELFQMVTSDDPNDTEMSRVVRAEAQKRSLVPHVPTHGKALEAYQKKISLQDVPVRRAVTDKVARDSARVALSAVARRPDFRKMVSARKVARVQAPKKQKQKVTKKQIAPPMLAIRDRSNTKKTKTKTPLPGKFVKVNRPTGNAYVSVGASTPQTFGNGPSLVVRHREMLMDLAGATPYNIAATFQLDAADATTFPWASSIASRYAKFRIRKLRFDYVPECSNTQTGAVIISADPSPARTPPTCKQAQMEIAATLKTPVWQCAGINVPCTGTWYESSPYVYPANPAGSPLSLLTPTVSSTYAVGDPRTYSAGVVYCASVGTPSVCGEIWIDYEIEFASPTQMLPDQVVDRIVVTSCAAGNTPFDSIATPGVLTVFGTNTLSFGTNTSVQIKYSGPMFIMMTCPTSAATTPSLTASAGHLQIVALSDNSGSFTACWTIDSAPVGQMLGLILGLTNLAPTTTVPFKMYFLGYDPLAQGTSTL